MNKLTYQSTSTSLIPPNRCFPTLFLPDLSSKFREYQIKGGSLVRPIGIIELTQQWWPEIQHHCEYSSQTYKLPVSSCRSCPHRRAKQKLTLAPGTPILLIGTKLDLRDDHHTIEKLRQKKQQPVQYAMGSAMSSEIKAAKVG